MLAHVRNLQYRILVVLLASWIALPTLADANDLCPYDTTGEYTMPGYIFNGDGKITFSGSHSWILDDTMACYKVFQWPGYIRYFPKCDTNGDGSVSISEVMDIYLRVHPAAHTAPETQTVCAEGYSDSQFYFCSTAEYSRVAGDIASIIDQYPPAATILDSESAGLGQSAVQYDLQDLTCTTTGEFSEGIFDSLNACYLGTATCVSEPCNEISVAFDRPLRQGLATAEYDDLAQLSGGHCVSKETGYDTVSNTPGFHIEPTQTPGRLLWQIRATAECVEDSCDCEMRYQLWTDADAPGQVLPAAGESSTVNLSNDNCTDARFACDTTLDSDGDGTNDCTDPCPIDPANTCPSAVELIEGFEVPGGEWPWAPWSQIEEYNLGQITGDVAHDGAFSLVPDGETYRTDISFGTVENEVLSMWCRTGEYGRCGLGVGADAIGAYYFTIEPVDNFIRLRNTRDSGPNISEIRASTWIEDGIESGAWHKIEVHVRADGVFDGQVFAADGVTPVGSLQYNLGTLPATGIAMLGYNENHLDTIERFIGVGSCVDIDNDGVCDADDLCDGDDANGDDDGDRVCNPDDLCFGFDLLGDADGDGDCDTVTCDPSTPPFYDQSGSDIEWAAGGTCAEMNGIEGPMACSMDEWQRHVDDINQIIGLYPLTNAVFDKSLIGAGQLFQEIPYTMLCWLPDATPKDEALFDDLNDCYHGTSRWLAGHSLTIIDFDWAVNIWTLADLYSDRAQLLGGECEPDYLAMGQPSGFHATDEQDDWIGWDAHAQHECDYFGCRCDATVTGWTNGSGDFFEGTVVNESSPFGQPPVACTDPLFQF